MFLPADCAEIFAAMTSINKNHPFLWLLTSLLMGTDFDDFGIAKRFGGFDLGNGIDKGFQLAPYWRFQQAQQWHLRPKIF